MPGCLERVGKVPLDKWYRSIWRFQKETHHFGGCPPKEKNAPNCCGWLPCFNVFMFVVVVVFLGGSPLKPANKRGASADLRCPCLGCRFAMICLKTTGFPMVQFIYQRTPFIWSNNAHLGLAGVTSFMYGPVSTPTQGPTVMAVGRRRHGVKKLTIVVANTTRPCEMHGCNGAAGSKCLSSRGTFPILSRDPSFWKTPKTQGWFLKRTIVEEKEGSTPRLACFQCSFRFKAG